MKNRLGFTLVEVMVTVAILSLGTLLIHQGLLRSANVLGHYNNLLAAQEWAADKMWDARESIFFSKESAPAAETSGSFSESGRHFDWSIVSTTQADADDLYLIKIIVTWQEGVGTISAEPSYYATFIKRGI